MLRQWWTNEKFMWQLSKIRRHGEFKSKHSARYQIQRLICQVSVAISFELQFLSKFQCSPCYHEQ